MIQIGIVERDAAGSASGVCESHDFNSSLMGNVNPGIITGSRRKTNYLLLCYHEVL